MSRPSSRQAPEPSPTIPIRRFLEQPGQKGAARFLAGVHVWPGCRQVGAALVVVQGQGLDARVEVVDFQQTATEETTVGLFRQLTLGDPGTRGVDLIGQLRSELAAVESALLVQLTSSSALGPGRVLAAGVHDPGLWSFSRGSVDAYLGLCDVARVAEQTGLNIVDALPARDVAQRGQGGPLAALAQWVLLADLQRTRVLVDLGRTVRMTLLPARTLPGANSCVLAFDVGPGMALLDLLAQELTGREQTFDPGGHLAVQGRKIPELLDHWLSDPYFDRPLPRWHPSGVRPERFLNSAVQMAVNAGWAVRDLLCTATHLVAESIARTLTRRLPADWPVDEVLVTGGGRHNGMLLRELGARLADTPLVVDHGLCECDAALEPACAAVLALFHLDQTPANPTAVTGAEIPRVLGRLTPGSPQNWQRLVHHLAETSQATRPLRSAL
ncbi:MAG: anhydro-N-acetylmuramic acid kinase [Pirellulales bacterium]|nr:anhydro-N-acetylmuramic acid kinase [Pirellulales bacterium]